MINYYLQIEVNNNLSNKNVKYIVDINVLENGQVVKISDTKMKIKISLPENLKGYKEYKVVYITNDEIKETIPATIEDEYLVFETSHLSHYGIVATEKTSNTNVANPKTSDNIIIYFIIGILSLTSLIVLKKKFNF